MISIEFQMDSVELPRKMEAATRTSRETWEFDIAHLNNTFAKSFLVKRNGLENSNLR